MTSEKVSHEIEFVVGVCLFGLFYGLCILLINANGQIGPCLPNLIQMICLDYAAATMFQH